MSEKPYRVAVSLRSGLTYTTEILHGIADYSRRHGPWALEVDSSFHFGQRPARIGPRWRGDGVILLGGESHPLDARHLRRHRIPVVNATGWPQRYPWAPRVFWDDLGIAALAGEHLAGLGLERFAYFGPRFFPPSHQRGQAFAAWLAGRGLPCSLCEWTREQVPEVAVWGARGWVRATRTFARMLECLRPPLGVLANNDVTASLVVQAAHDVGLRCPQDLAVVGFWNDRVICESTRPPLTSIETDFHEVGFQAAALLDAMMRDPAFAPPALTTVRTKGLTRRESTDYLGFDDEPIARALRYIRRHAPERPLTVDEVLETVPMSRSSFGARFRAAVGHSAKAEIQRVRVEEVKRLLRETTWPVTRIAQHLKFDSPMDLARLFRLKVMQTPGEFRAQHGRATH